MARRWDTSVRSASERRGLILQEIPIVAIVVVKSIANMVHTNIIPKREIKPSPSGSHRHACRRSRGCVAARRALEHRIGCKVPDDHAILT